MNGIAYPTHALLLTLFLGIAGESDARPGKLGGKDAAQGQALLLQLQTAEHRLKTSPTLETASAIHGAMIAFEAIVDRYFHASNLTAPESRQTVLALRNTLREGFAGPSPLFFVRTDVFHFRGSLHALLGQVFARHADYAAAVQAYSRALAAVPDQRQWLAALLEIFVTSKDPRAALVRARLAHLNAASEGVTNGSDGHP